MNTSASKDLISSKSLLAKLMATENITVRHLAVKTAWFDTLHRILTCPIWKDMDGELYDLLMGHEVGHALWTDWKELEAAQKTKPNSKFFAGCLNIVEDARIEKLIKRKYPGIRRSFVEGYIDLHERNFFGLKTDPRKLSERNMVDRFNLYFKLGSHLFLNFTPEERQFIDRGEKLETYDDVLALATDLYDYAKKEKKKKEKQQRKQEQQQKERAQNPEPQEEDQQDEYYSDSDEDEDQDDQEPAYPDEPEDDDGGVESAAGEESDEDSDDGEEKTDDSKDEAEDEDEESEAESKSVKTEEEKSEDKISTAPSTKEDHQEEDDSEDEDEDDEDDGGVEPTADTQDAFKRNEETLVDGYSSPTINLELPDSNLENIIIPNAKVVKKFTDSIILQCQNKHPTRYPDPYRKAFDYNDLTRVMSNQFIRKNGKYISLLVKEFEMRKNASQYSRQKQSRSGVLDTRRLDKYRFTSDIFKKVTTVDKGKNHGMIMFLDMSSSMYSQFRDAVEQILILVTFCKKINIPFDVYGFTTHESYEYTMDVDDYFPTGNKFNYRATSDAEQVVKLNADTMGNNNEFILYENFHLKQLITSNVNAAMYKKAFNMLLTMGEFMQYNHDRSKEIRSICGSFNLDQTQLGMVLNGTPLTATVVASIKIVKKFKMDNHVDIVNVIHMTDGDSTDSVYHAGSYDSKLNINAVDRASKLSIPMKRTGYGNWNYQESFTSLARLATGCKNIGFFVDEKRALTQRIGGIEKDYTKKAQMSKNLTQNGYTEYPCLGYDSYFYVVTSGLERKDEFVTEEGISKTKLAGEFIKNQNKKHNSRVVGAAFAKYISE